MLRVPILALLLLTAPRLAHADDVSPREEHERPAPESLRSLLMAFEHGPRPREWQALGPSIVPALGRLAEDEREPVFVRMRAVQAAAHFTTDAARNLLRRALSSHEPLVVREAALGMARAFGASAVRELCPLLDHDDTAVREAAIVALGSIACRRDLSHLEGACSGEAARALLARLAHEQDEFLRAELQRQLSGVGGSNPE